MRPATDGGATREVEPPKPRSYAVITTVLVLLVVAYVGGYVVARVTRRIVHVHWGGLGRYGCSHLESTGWAARAWRPLIATETWARFSVDDRWGHCPDVME